MSEHEHVYELVITDMWNDDEGRNEYCVVGRDMTGEYPDLDEEEIIRRVNSYPKLNAENERLRRELTLDNVQFGQIEADDICN